MSAGEAQHTDEAAADTVSAEPEAVVPDEFVPEAVVSEAVESGAEAEASDDTDAQAIVDAEAAEQARNREARRAIEAVLMVATEPVEPAVLAQLVELPTARVEELCSALAASYEIDERGFVLARVAGGYRFQTHPEFAPYVERFVLDGQHARLSPAALETLAIVAYKQPISRAQVSAIRGVNVDATMRTLAQRGYIEEVGTEPTPGNPSLFGTTRTFLERLGLDSLNDLPPLGDFVPEAHVVEALERGLRVTPEVAAPEAPAETAADVEAAPEAEAALEAVEVETTETLAAEPEVVEAEVVDAVEAEVVEAVEAVVDVAEAERAEAADAGTPEVASSDLAIAADLAAGMAEHD